MSVALWRIIALILASLSTMTALAQDAGVDASSPERLSHDGDAEIALVEPANDGQVDRGNATQPDAGPAAPSSEQPERVAVSVAPPAGASALSASGGYGASARIHRPANVGEFDRYGSGSKFNVSLEETPASITVTDRAAVRERGIVDVHQALGWMSGVMPTAQYGAFQHIRVRGFQVIPLFDGRRDSRSVIADSAPQVGLLDLERIELLRGAAALLYGYGVVGGAMNQIRRRASRSAGYELDLALGAPNQHRVHGGAQGPIGTKVAYRADIGHSTHENYRGQREQRNQVTTTLRYNPRRQHTLGLRLSYSRDTFNTDVGLPTIEDPARPGMWRLPPNTRLENRYHSRNDHLDYERVELTGDYRYDITPATRVEVRAAVTRDDYDYLAAEVLNYQPAMPPLTERAQVLRESLWFRRRWTPVYGQVELLSQQTTGPVEHQLLLGYSLDLLRGLSQRGNFGDAPEAAPIDFIAPADRSTPVAFHRTRYDHYRYLVHSVYGFDHIQLAEPLILTGGVRLDALRIRTRAEPVDPITDRELPNAESGAFHAANEWNDEVVTGQAGVVYRPWDPLVTYVSYGAAYTPRLVSPAASNVRGYKPERAHQFEGGVRVRVEERGHRLDIDAAGYFIRKTNLVMNRGPDEFVQAGVVVSRGLDLSVRYRAPQFFELELGYALTAAEYRRYASPDVTLPDMQRYVDRAGNQVDFTPRHSGNGWLRILPLTGLGLGIGGRMMSAQYGDPENRLPMRGYGLLDGSLWYGNEHTTVTVSASNLLDRRAYFTSAINTWAPNPQLTPGPGRELLVALRLTL